MDSIPIHAAPALVAAPTVAERALVYFELAYGKVKTDEWAWVYEVRWTAGEEVEVLTPPEGEDPEDYLYKVYDPMRIFWGTGRDEEVDPIVPGTRGVAKRIGQQLIIENMDCP